jgi:hypothetical protein
MKKHREYNGNKVFTSYSVSSGQGSYHVTHYHLVEVDENGNVKIYDTSHGPQHTHRIDGTDIEPEINHSHDFTEILKALIEEIKDGKIKN